MKLRFKLTLVSGILFLSVVLITVLSVWTMTVTARLATTIEEGDRLLTTALTVHGLMKDMMVDLFTPQTYRLLKDVLHTARFQSARQDLRSAVTQFEGSVADFMGSPGVRGLLRDQELRDAWDTAGIMSAKASQRIASFVATVDRLYASGTTGSANLYMRLQTGGNADTPRFFDEVRETSYYLTYSFESFLSHFIGSLRQESELIRRQILLAFWSLTALIGAACLTVSLLFARRISERIGSVEEGVRAAARGDFGARLAIHTSDEFGELAAHFNLFMMELKKNVDAIQSLMRDVGESLTARPGYQRILELIVEAAVRDSRADGAAVFVTDPSFGLVVASAAGDFPLPVRAGLPPDEPLLHSIVEQRQPVFLRDELRLGHRPVRSLLALPLTASQGAIGLLCVITVPPHPPLADLDFTTFGSFAGYAGLIIDNFFKYRELLEKRDAEYRALQSQIQPHFLYNVLNALVGLNRMGDARALEGALFSLKDMLRYILDAEGWTTLGEEIEFLRRYCALQQLRFAERLAVSITCEPGAAGTRIPKLLLQPVVENAVIHGIEPLDRPGRLVVEARAAGGNGARTIRVTVRDDGVGFSPEAGMGARHIGLANVRERLLIACPDARLAVESAPDAGTTITLDLPGGNGADPHC